MYLIIKLKWEEYNRQLLRSHDLNNAIHQISESFYGDLFDYDETGYSEDAGLMTDKKIQKMPDIDPLIDTQGCLVWNESLWTGETESGDID